MDDEHTVLLEQDDTLQRAEVAFALAVTQKLGWLVEAALPLETFDTEVVVQRPVAAAFGRLLD